MAVPRLEFTGAVPSVRSGDGGAVPWIHVPAALADLLGTPSAQPQGAGGEDGRRGPARGVLAGAVGAIAWLLAVVLSGTIFFVLIAVTVLALVYTVCRGDKARLGLWGLIAIAWALVLAERWVVNDNGGVIIAGAA